MKIKYWGTAAAEGVPAVFCKCEVCRYARRMKGREIRTRSQAVIDDELLMDFGPDTFMHMLQYDFDLADVRYCLITHSHEDHLLIPDLSYRKAGFANLPQDIPPLVVCGGAGVKQALRPDDKGRVTADGRVIFRLFEAYKAYEIAGYKVTPLPAIHGTLDPLVYIIEKQGKVLLYGNDTGIFAEDTWEFLRQSGIVFDVVSLDCTAGKLSIDYKEHMNFERNLYMKSRMEELHLVRPDTIFISTHFSHNGEMTYKDAVVYGEKHGLMIAYDGMEFSF